MNDAGVIAARHAEIARRYKRAKGKGVPVSITALRIAQLCRLFTDRYGPVLPDDDAGRGDAFIMAHHLARCPEPDRCITSWLSLWAPWMTATEVEALTARVVDNPFRWGADKLARLLNLHEADRRRLRITTIGACDVTKEERAKRRQAAKRLRRKRRRRAKGVRPRAEYEANSISRTKPWEAEGICRRTWERRQKAMPQV